MLGLIQLIPAFGVESIVSIAEKKEANIGYHTVRVDSAP